MKRNVLKRAFATFWQAGIPAAGLAIEDAWRTGDFSWRSGAYIAAAFVAAGASALSNQLQNRRREGPVED